MLLAITIKDAKFAVMCHAVQRDPLQIALSPTRKESNETILMYN